MENVLKSALESNNKTYKMLISLLDKWQDKNYDLTDAEWNTIKSYKSLLDLFFNDKAEIQKLITSNEETITNL